VATKTGTNDASDVVCALSMSFFLGVFFNMLTNVSILAQGGLMTTVGAAAIKMMYLVGVTGVQT
jgi:hypothetical protein